MRLYSNEFPEKFIDINVKFFRFPHISFVLHDTNIPLLSDEPQVYFRRSIFCSRFIKFYGYTFDVPKEFIHG